MRKSTGISLMLLIFLSLSLMIFSLLSLSGAKADAALSQKAADRTAEYYAASNEAQQCLSLIDALLAKHLLKAEETANPEKNFLEACQSIPAELSQISWSEMTELSGELILAFSVPVKEDQVLLTELSIHYPRQDSDTLYTVTSREVQNTDEWTPDRSQNVYLP